MNSLLPVSEGRWSGRCLRNLGARDVVCPLENAIGTQPKSLADVDNTIHSRALRYLRSRKQWQNQGHGSVTLVHHRPTLDPQPRNTSMMFFVEMIVPSIGCGPSSKRQNRPKVRVAAKSSASSRWAKAFHHANHHPELNQLTGTGQGPRRRNGR